MLLKHNFTIKSATILKHRFFDLINLCIYFFQFETLLPDSKQDFMHHWLMYECDHRFEDLYLKNNTKPKAGPCYPNFETPSTPYDSKWDTVSKYCRKISIGWAIGGDYVRNLNKLKIIFCD